jgi:drug/metabolite transporter (DMT)-like permease
MKNALFNTGNIWLGLLSTFILLVPIILVLIKKSSWNTWFIPLVLCFLLLFCTGLLNNGFIDFGEKTNAAIVTCSIVFQAPLIIIFLHYFGLNPEMKKAIQVSLISYLLGGAVFLAINGVNGQTIGLILGTGISLVLIYGTIIFVRQIKESIHSRKQTGKAFMISAVVFAYSCYFFIYLMNFVFDSSEKKEIILLFQLATIVSTILVSIGILMNVKNQAEKPAEVKVSKLPMLTDWEEYTTGKN